MKILYYNESFQSADGSRKHAEHLYDALDNDKRIERIDTYPKKLPPLITYKTKSRSNNTSKLFQILRLIKRIIQSFFVVIKLRNSINEYDLIIARCSTFDITPILIKYFFKIPYVYECNSPIYYELGSLRNGSLIKFVEFWESALLKKSLFIYTVSLQLSSILTNHYKIDNKKIYAIFNGYNPINLTDKVDKPTLLKSIKFHKFQDKFVITFIGSLKIWHGVDKIIKLSTHYLQKDKNILFLIIGDGEMREAVKSCKNSNLVYIETLPLNEMHEYLLVSDLGIMPYNKIDKFYFSPLKMYDMIGAYLPFVSLNIGQIQDVHTKSPSIGFTINNDNLASYIDIIDAVRNNRTILEEKRKELKKTRINYTWEMRGHELTEIILNTFNNTHKQI